MLPSQWLRRLAWLLALGSTLGAGAPPPSSAGRADTPAVPLAAPRLFAGPFHQSLVRIAADDVVMLAGDGLAAGDRVLLQPVDVPASGSVGERPAGPAPRPLEAPVLSAAGAPQSLVVRIPDAVLASRTYSLWVRAADGRASNVVRVNDLRPLWFSPAFVHSTAARPGLARRLKIVGRNLDAVPGAPLRIRLTGPASHELRTLAVDGGEAGQERYAAQALLPDALRAGRYRVEASRDDRTWVQVAGQELVVLPDPPPVRAFDVGAAAFGRCVADDAHDDTPCLLAALEAARQAGGGAVRFGPGRWWLDSRHPARRGDGLVVPSGVSIEGAGAARTQLVTAGAAESATAAPAFTLRGDNVVSGLAFVDERTHALRSWSGAALRIGSPAPATPETPASVGAAEIRRVTITGNRFANTYFGVQDAGVPIRDLVVTDNEFGAFLIGLALSGDRFRVDGPFGLADAVITGNTFKPGTALDVPGRVGPMASELGASRRVDFSDNLADGSDTTYSGPPPAASGWRAGFFWHALGNHEGLLVGANIVKCAGDRVGDGEAIAFDNNGNTMAFARAANVVAASVDGVVVDEPLVRRQHGRDVDAPRYYLGQWIFVAAGRGLGQARRVVGLEPRADGKVGVRVEPRWDVVPTGAGVRVVVSRNFWQVYAVDNVIEQGEPTCHKSNRSQPKGGGLVLYAQITDSVVAGNRLHETDGISVPMFYSAEDPACADCGSVAFLSYFVSIERNRIEGEYEWRSDCSWSGIQLAYSASPTPRSPPPVAGFGVSVARNLVRGADGMRGGAIVFSRGWYAGPPPHDWTLVRDVVVHHNRIEAMTGPTPSRRCDLPRRLRIGINLDDAALVHDTVLYANQCVDVDQPLRDEGRGTRAICAPGASPWCECAAPEPGR